MTGKRKILIADDHALIRLTLRHMMEGIDFEVIEVVDGQQAVEAFEKENPDWTLMDLEMPILDGLSATRAILSKHPEARVIMLTQYDEPVWRDEAREAGAMSFFNKEKIHELISVLIHSKSNHSMYPPSQDK